MSKDKTRIAFLSAVCAILCIPTIFLSAYIWKKEVKAEETQTYEYAIFSPTVWQVINTSTNEKEIKGIQGTITITFNNFNAQLWYKEKISETTNFKYVGNQRANITDENQDENNEILFHFRIKDNASNAYIHIFIQQKNNIITNNGILQTKTNELQAAPTTYEYLSNLCACYLSDGTKIVLLVTAYENVFTTRPDGGNLIGRKENLSNPYLFNHITLQSTDIEEAYNQGYKDGNKGKNEYGTKEYNRGKNDGIQSANKYTFESLITSVLDVPIQTIYGLFNFELLGINLLNLITALLTLAIIIFIIKAVI